MRTRGVVLVAVVALLLGAGVTWVLVRPRPAALPPVSLAVTLPAEQSPDSVALSPDGLQLVFSAETGGRLQLYRRAVDRYQIEAIPNTEGAHSPFFSPDSTWVAFFADGKLRKTRVTGGAAAEDICEAPIDSAGGAWGEDGTVVFAPLHGGGLVRVSASGGKPEVLTRPDTKAGEVAHGWPQILPEGRGVLFTVSRRDRDSRLAVLLRDGTVRPLAIPLMGQAAWVRGDLLAYGLRGELLAVRFDPERLRPAGVPFVLATDLRSALGFDALDRACFSASREGPIVYVPGPAGEPDSVPVWVDRQGRATPTRFAPAHYQSPRLSPDGTRVAVAIRSALMARDIWVQELASGARLRLSPAGGDSQSPVWMPDSRRLTFASTASGAQNVYVRPLEEGADAQLLLAGGAVHNPASWSRDGRMLAYYDVDPSKGRDVWVLDRDGEIRAVAATGANERAPSLSPDGAWMAYVSDESGADEIYVVPTATGGTARRVSSSGGTEPLWSPTGLEIFYRQADRLMTVPVIPGPSPRFDAARPLFEGQYLLDSGGNQPNYDVSSDGQRFLMLRSADRPREIRILLNWASRVPNERRR